MPNKILLVIPCYNDSAKLGAFLPKLCRVVSDVGLGIQIHVVDDGSSIFEVSKIKELLNTCKEKYSAHLSFSFLPTNQGKGAAVYSGWGHATDEEWLAFLDVDGAVPATEIVRLCEYAILNTSVDAILASRVRMLGHEIKRGLKRHFFDRFYSTIAKFLLSVPAYDIQCGFKIFRKSCIEIVRIDLKTLRFGFDLELVAKFYIKGFRLLEMPIRSWKEVPVARARLMQDFFEFFLTLLKLEKNFSKISWMLSNKNK